MPFKHTQCQLCFCNSIGEACITITHSFISITPHELSCSHAFYRVYETSLKRHLLWKLINLHPTNCEQCIVATRCENSQWNVLSVQCFLLIMCLFTMFPSVYLPHGRQDVNGWPTWSPMCLSRNKTTRKIRDREDRPSHPDAANLLPASHVKRYTIV